MILSHHFGDIAGHFKCHSQLEKIHTRIAKLPALQRGWRDTDNNHYYKLNGVTSPSSNLSSQHLAKNQLSQQSPEIRLPQNEQNIKAYDLEFLSLSIILSGWQSTFCNQNKLLQLSFKMKSIFPLPPNVRLNYQRFKALDVDSLFIHS